MEGKNKLGNGRKKVYIVDLVTRCCNSCTVLRLLHLGAIVLQCLYHFTALARRGNSLAALARRGSYFATFALSYSSCTQGSYLAAFALACSFCTRGSHLTAFAPRGDCFAGLAPGGSCLALACSSCTRGQLSRGSCTLQLLHWLQLLHLGAAVLQVLHLGAAVS